MKWNVLALAVATVLAGCSSSFPKPDFSTQERISGEMARVSAAAKNSGSASKDKPQTAVVSTAVLGALVQSPESAGGVPAGRTVRSASPQRFDLMVSDAPIGQVLSGLVEGTEYSIMLKSVSEASTVAAASGATGVANTAVKTESVDVSGKRVSFKLKNITLFDALDAIRDVYGYDYTVEGRRILVHPAELQTRLFYVNYILGQRRGVSDIQVIGGASVGGASTVSSTTTSSSYGSVQATGLSTAVKADVWAEAEDALRTLLGCNIAKVAAINPALARPATSGGQNNASRADVYNAAEPSLGERQRGVDGCTQGRALAINAMSGTILVRGMPTELRMVEHLLKTMQISISRQVIIESKIIDVELNKEAQQGINWSVFNQGMHRLSVGANTSTIGVNQPGVVGQPGGAVIGGASTSLQTLLGTNTSPAGSALGGVGGIAFQATNFASLINFMELQGRVHVLSSPRISTMNNQKAVIKVGSEEPFVTNMTGGITTTTVSGPTTTTPTLTYQPFFSGIALDVTPQIDADDNITLHVHSMVNRVVEKDKLALTANGSTTGSIMVPFAVNSMNETDSVVKARDGQVVVIGGLMSERNSDTRGGVPGARDVPVAGGLFNWGSQQSNKRELVILLKPIVVKDDGAWSNTISETEERISGMQQTAPR